MGKYLIMIGCAILVIIGLLIRQWFIGLSPKKTGEAEEETQVYSDLTKTGVRIKLKWIQTIYLCYEFFICITASSAGTQWRLI